MATNKTNRRTRVSQANVAAVCVYCCASPATTRDHVPPRNLFPKPRPPLITVPSCVLHNRGASIDDEYLRLSLVVNKGVAPHPDARRAWKAIYRGLQRPEAAGLKAGFLKTIARTPLFSPAGLYLGERMTYAVDGRRQAQEAARIMRGVYYDRTKQLLPNHHVIAYPIELLSRYPRRSNVLLPLANEALKMTTRAPDVTIGNDVFAYWSMEILTSTVVLWVLAFFGKSLFVGFAIPKSELPGGHRGYGFP